MMRLATSASLVVLLFLLASLGTASAECAWVLWGNIYLSAPPELPGRDEWSVVDTADTRERCMVLLQRRVAAATELQVIERGESFVVAKPTAPKPGVTMYARMQCLPDTIDPRGPKGK